jgi:hypothetical protein
VTDRPVEAARPESFRGLLLRGSISESVVSFALSEDSDSRFEFQAPIVDSTVILFFSFAARRVLLATMDVATKDLIEIADVELRGGLDDNVIGITAQSDEYTSLVVLRSITFHVDDRRTGFRSSPERAAPLFGEHFEPRVRQRLRNPTFFSMRTEILQFENVRGDLNGPLDPTNVHHVLNVIDELREVSSEVASFSDLNNFIRTTLIPYTQTWSKRTHQILGYVESAKGTTLRACDMARQIAFEFRFIKNLSVVTTEARVGDLARDLEDSLLENFDADVIAVTWANERFVEILKMFALLELGLLVAGVTLCSK